MITINHLSFDLVTADETFAHNLYAEWDNFCRVCIEKVVNECFSAYDKNKVFHEIETLDLDLSYIPEDDFFQEFPRRLREELLKSVPLWDIQSENQRKKTEASRLENLLFYLEHGYQKAEWMGGDFDLTEELEWAATQPEAYTDKIIPLYLSKEYVLRRLLWQTDNENILLHIFATSLFNPSFSLYEKRRFLGMLLDTKPNIPVRFIHEVKDEMQLHEMAELLDTLFVRQVMITETREHAEVDLPPYWHYLYEWLIRYYPFNGLAIFGGKNEFIRHLHHRLLTFIRKRNYSFYLSKEELTVGFLLEVFGHTYYKDVLNAIYDLQPLQADGSPVYDGYLNRELYRMFLHLSLLRLPYVTGKNEKVSGTNNPENKDIEAVLNLLLNNGIYTGHSVVSADHKRELLQEVVTEKPQEWISLLQKLPEASKAVFLVARYLSVRSILQGMAKASFYQAAVLSQAVEWLQYKANDFPFLAGGNITLSSALPQALLFYMQDKDTLSGRTLTKQEAIQKFLSFLYFVYTSKSDYRDNAEWMVLSDCIATGMNRNDVQNVEDKDVTGNNEIIKNKEIAELSNINQPEILRQRWLRSYLYCQPKELLDYIRLSITQNIIPLDKWLEWLDIDDWMRLVASLSLSNAELLQQITDCLSENNQAREIDLRMALATYIVENHVETCMYNNRNETIYSFVQSLPFKNKKDMDLKVEEVLRIMENYPTEEMKTETPESFHVNNAGLCLLSPWFPRLMHMCDLLDEHRMSFKNDLCRLHAVFLLQYLTCSEEREYAETELAFNRMLVGLPMHLPLPKRLELTTKEKEMADSMLEGVKSNWTHMRNTSMKGFQQNFIVRGGELVQQEDKWLLTVEERTIDILLEYIPWPFKLIRLPWLKKYVQVHWHEK
nr:contractile injection system tape measure protein [Parabacteroides goldsteinii]